MRSLWITILCVSLVVAQAFAQETTTLKTKKERVSYSLGISIAKNLKSRAIEVDPDIVAQGLRDAISGRKTLLTDSEIEEVLTDLQNEITGKQDEETISAAERNKKEGEAFLSENKKKEGVITLPSGLQYKVLRKGNGPRPKVTDTVVTHYRGTTIDGTEFDSSYTHHEPITFVVGNVIKGWTEALQRMEVGSKFELFIPPDLAYGSLGAQKMIGPNATLIFEIELLSIKGQK